MNVVTDESRMEWQWNHGSQMKNSEKNPKNSMKKFNRVTGKEKSEGAAGVQKRRRRGWLVREKMRLKIDQQW